MRFFSMTKRNGRLRAVVAAITLLVQPALVSAQSGATHDGKNDFDWMVGTWKVKLSRLTKPLTGSTTWVEYEGTQVTRKIWDGRAVMDEFVAESATAKVRVDGLTIRLYNPESRQWSIYWANAKNGVLGLPPTVGGFKNGRGEFYDEEEFDGKQITVRYIWSDITPTSARFEQAFSTDGGKTWEPNWISTISRVKE